MAGSLTGPQSLFCNFQITLAIFRRLSRKALQQPKVHSLKFYIPNSCLRHKAQACWLRACHTDGAVCTYPHILHASAPDHSAGAPCAELCKIFLCFQLLHDLQHTRAPLRFACQDQLLRHTSWHVLETTKCSSWASMQLLNSHPQKCQRELYKEQAVQTHDACRKPLTPVPMKAFT